jgi:hypothetical protein
MKVDISKIERIAKLLSSKDPLLAFAANGEKAWLIRQQRKNFSNIIKGARKYNLRYIYIGKGEVSGCEEIHQPNSLWPAIWDVVKEAGFPSNCGNTDQYQTCDYNGVYFPPYAYGAWDLIKGRQLTNKEIGERKFQWIVTDPRRQRRIP